MFKKYFFVLQEYNNVYFREKKVFCQIDQKFVKTWGKFFYELI